MEPQDQPIKSTSKKKVDEVRGGYSSGEFASLTRLAGVGEA